MSTIDFIFFGLAGLMLFIFAPALADLNSREFERVFHKTPRKDITALIYRFVGLGFLVLSALDYFKGVRNP